MSDEKDPVLIEIRPDVNILGVLRNLNYKPWFALAEFVDNAVQSFVANSSEGDRLHVSITIDGDAGGRIVIADDAFGIAKEDFPRAFRAAEVPPNRSGLSEFGMGMKSAATWFARRWTVRTSVAGEAVERSVFFDMDDISGRRIEHLPVRELPAERDSHFTIVELTDLNHLPRGRSVDKIKRHLASIYRMFLRDGDVELRYNGASLSFDEVSTLVAPPAWAQTEPARRWESDIDIQLDDSHRVFGWVGVRERGSTREAGLALFRRKRLIIGSDDDTYRPTAIFGGSNSFEYQRIYGELRLEGFDVSYTKDGIQWDELEDVLHEKLGLALKGEPNIIKQARQYRASSANADQLRTLIRDANEVSGDLAARVGLTESNAGTTSEDAESYTVELEQEVTSGDGRATSNTSFANTARIVTANRVWIVRTEADAIAPAVDWLQLTGDQDGHDIRTNLPSTMVSLRIALAHPFTLEFLGARGDGARPLLAFAGAIGVSLVRARRAGLKSTAFLTYLNQLLSTKIEVSES
ncbi:ATP-binding protein [Curtobacterium sp. MCBD17_026]|uniref:ATP-binding protein n=1 Tax=Curtobacterium sp. MCBD17_026 TaxID=2175621 RepID=UPI000DA964D4|nr:ATP-binding protein [Curtobacterium sp. MCBD17_026]WIB69583.1 ATP-binding protein [Curtobacterium sp. MCBD17_026]